MFLVGHANEPLGLSAPGDLHDEPIEQDFAERVTDTEPA